MERNASRGAAAGLQARRQGLTQRSFNQSKRQVWVVAALVCGYLVTGEVVRAQGSGVYVGILGLVLIGRIRVPVLELLTLVASLSCGVAEPLLLPCLS